GIKAIGVQRLLQPTSNSFGTEGTNTDRDSGIQRRGVERLSLGEALSRAIPDANRCMSTNSPCTGPESLAELLCGTDYRKYSSRMPEPRDRHERAASPANPKKLLKL